jgi:hypothetical protein
MSFPVAILGAPRAARPRAARLHGAVHQRQVEDFRGLQQPLLVVHHSPLRGDLVSRPTADVLREAERRVDAGVKELLVISLDTSAYGVDIKYAASTHKGREVRARFLDLAGELGVHDGSCGSGT